MKLHATISAQKASFAGQRVRHVKSTTGQSTGGERIKLQAVLRRKMSFLFSALCRENFSFHPACLLPHRSQCVFLPSCSSLEYECEFMHLFWTCQREAAFQKAKICFRTPVFLYLQGCNQSQLVIQGQRILQWNPVSSVSVQKVFLYTHAHHPQTQSPRSAPEIQAKVMEILFVVAKQNIPEP